MTVDQIIAEHKSETFDNFDAMFRGQGMTFTADIRSSLKRIFEDNIVKG